MTNVAIVPARGGSKRIPGKNARSLFGKPVIVWVCETLVESGVFDEVIVSTDSSRIAEYVKVVDSVKVVNRPAELGVDSVPIREVVRGTLKTITDRLGAFEGDVCLVYATAALLTESQLRESHSYFVSRRRIHSVLAVQEVFASEDLKFHLSPGGLLTMTRGSSRPSPYFRDAGQFCWATAEHWLSERSITEGAVPYFLARSEGVDVNTSDDWKILEALFHHGRLGL